MYLRKMLIRYRFYDSNLQPCLIRQDILTQIAFSLMAACTWRHFNLTRRHSMGERKTEWAILFFSPPSVFFSPPEVSWLLIIIQQPCFSTNQKSVRVLRGNGGFRVLSHLPACQGRNTILHWPLQTSREKKKKKPCTHTRGPMYEITIWEERMAVRMGNRNGCLHASPCPITWTAHLKREQQRPNNDKSLSL